MINLIPRQAKKSLKKEYWLRVISVWLMVWSFALIVGAVMLFPVYILITSQTNVYETSALEASERVVGYENVSSDLVKASQQARLIIDESSVKVFSEYVALFESTEGAGVQINEIIISRDQDGVTPVSLSGVAVGRQSLANFRDNILSLEVVSEVDLPISDLVRDKDIAFSLTIVLDNTKDI